MANLEVFNQKGEKLSSIKVDDSVFGAEFNEPLVHQVMVAQMNNARQGTKCTLTRAEVRGGGRKPWRQKGTGRARQGSIRSPQWNGGGVVFAPKPRDFSQKINKQQKRLALVSLLSEKARQSEILVLEDIKLKQPKTKEMSSIMKKLKLDIKTHKLIDEKGRVEVKQSKALPKILLLVENADEKVLRAAQNLPYIKTIPVSLINVYDILASDKCVLTVAGVKKLEEAYKEVAK